MQVIKVDLEDGLGLVQVCVEDGESIRFRRFVTDCHDLLIKKSYIDAEYEHQMKEVCGV